MDNFQIDLSKINNKYLKNGFKLDTNLSDIRGKGVIELLDSMNLLSPESPNKTIIERLMYEHSITFKTAQSIKAVMEKSDPVIWAFNALGTCDRKCTIQWLIFTLVKIREFRPLQSLLRTAPPTIESPMSGKTVKPGEVITFVIYTIAEARIQWWKCYKDKMEIVQDHIRVPKYSFTGQAVSYQTKNNDLGHFYIEVNCNCEFRKLSPSINVGIDEIFSLKINEDEPEPETVTKRVALLIGIMDYESKGPLKSLQAPQTDIIELEGVLLSIGFTVFCFGDLDLNHMINILTRFSESYVSENTYLFFYFAGHGNISKEVDNLKLTHGQITVVDVLKILNKNKPKVLIGIFDMCRDNGNQNESNSDIAKACLPVSENLVLVMSTLPYQKAYEKVNECECTSLIMKPLCENLSKYACNNSINMVLTRFINDCENIEQKPTITAVGMTEIIGTKSSVSRMRPRLTWMKIPEDQNIMNYITIDFKIFYNIINIFIDPVSSKNEKSVFEIPLSTRSLKKISTNELDGSVKINLFDHFNLVPDSRTLEIYVVNECSVKYPIRIEIPKLIVPFYENIGSSCNDKIT